MEPIPIDKTCAWPTPTITLVMKSFSQRQALSGRAVGQKCARSSVSGRHHVVSVRAYSGWILGFPLRFVGSCHV